MKTVFMHICRHRNTDGTWCLKKSPEISLYGKPIQCKDAHKYLGLLFDASLRWHKHIEYLRIECQKRLNILKYLSHANWGADSKTMLRIYTAYIKPKIEYGVEAYGSACASMLKKLDPLQNASLRIATGAYRTSPVDSIEVIAGIKPLSLSREEKMANYMVRIISTPQNPLKELFRNPSQMPEQMTKFEQNSIKHRIKHTAKKYDVKSNMIIEEIIPDHPPWEISGISTCEEITQIVKRDSNPHSMKARYTAHIDTHDSMQFTAYTDGSKTEKGVAYAFTAKGPNIPAINKAVRMNDASSIFSAELHAILGALNAGIQKGASRMTVFTDSKSSIQAVMKPYHRNPTVIKIQKTVHQTSSKLHMCWIPSHVGINGNETADSLANNATTSTTRWKNKLTREEYR